LQCIAAAELFPLDGVVSLVTALDDGAIVEVAPSATTASWACR
jgi:hypothetical protein